MQRSAEFTKGLDRRLIYSDQAMRLRLNLNSMALKATQADAMTRRRSSRGNSWRGSDGNMKGCFP